MPLAIKHFYEFGGFRLDADKHRLSRHGEVVPLSPKAAEALLVFVQNPGRPLEREELMKAVWADSFVEDANLTVAISQLRKALGQNGDTAEYIETIPRVGYRFVAKVRDVIAQPTPLIVEKHTRSQTVIEEEFLADEPPPATAITVSAEAFAPARLRVRNRHRTLALAALAVLLTSTGFFLLRRGHQQSVAPALLATRSIRSIAILPPRALTDEQQNVALSLGIADALITRLGGLNKLVVRPTSGVVRYVGNNPDPLSAGRALGVDGVLEGTLQRDGSRVRVTLRLVSVTDGTQLWAGNFDEADGDIFKLQDAVSREVAEALFLDLTPNDKAVLSKQQTANPEAYALYLKGNYFWSRRGVEPAKSLEYYRKAIELDPNFVQAYVGLATVNATSFVPSPEAEALIDKALQLDNSSAEAHATYGFIRMFHHFDWVTAERELDRAIELNPNSVTAHHWKGVYWSLRGRLDEAKAEMHRALDLDPQSLIVTADIGQLHYFAHEYDQAIEYCNRALAIDNSFFNAHVYLRDIYQMKGMDQECFDELLRTAVPADRAAKAQSIFVQAGRKGVLSAELDDPIQLTVTGHMAWLSASLRNREKTLEYLNRALQEKGEGAFFLPFINVDPLYDFLRDDPRFKEILHRMGLT